MHVRFKQDPEDFELGSLLLEYINEVLNQNILTGDEKRSYTYLEDEIGDLLYRYYPQRVEGLQYRRRWRIWWMWAITLSPRNGPAER